MSELSLEYNKDRRLPIDKSTGSNKTLKLEKLNSSRVEKLHRRCRFQNGIVFLTKGT